MQKITKDAAECAIEKLSLGDKNRAFVGYWLSLWQGDALPRLERFDASRLPVHAPGLVVFDVAPERRVLIRSAGSDICRAVGLPLGGIDWVAYAPLRNQKLRMQNMSEVANGSLLLARRPFLLGSGAQRVNEELVLPFAPDADGVSPVMACIDWKIEGTDALTSVTTIAGVAHDRLMRLRRRKSPSSRDMEAA